MSTLPRDFLQIAKNAKVTTHEPVVKFEGRATFTKYCFACGCHMPHVLTEGKSICIVCGPKAEK